MRNEGREEGESQQSSVTVGSYSLEKCEASQLLNFVISWIPSTNRRWKSSLPIYPLSPLVYSAEREVHVVFLHGVAVMNDELSIGQFRDI